MASARFGDIGGVCGPFDKVSGWGVIVIFGLEGTSASNQRIFIAGRESKIDERIFDQR